MPFYLQNASKRRMLCFMNKKMSNNQPISARCPIRYSMEMFGDRWSLLIIRDMAFRDMSRYGHLLEELGDISTNILASRLKQLEEKGLIESFYDPVDRKSVIYLLTDKGLSLVPVLAEMVKWGAEHDEYARVPERFMQLVKAGFGEWIEEKKITLAARRAELKRKVVSKASV